MGVRRHKIQRNIERFEFGIEIGEKKLNIIRVDDTMDRVKIYDNGLEDRTTDERKRSARFVPEKM